VKNQILILDLTKSDHQKQCLEISKSIFGVSYHDLSFFKKENNTISIVATTNDIAIGFLIANSISEKKVKLDCVGITQKFQKQKVGTKLMSHFIEHKLPKQIKIIAHAWKNSDGINASKLNTKFGLKQTKNLGKVWINECNKVFTCPYYNCGCHCESIEFCS
jgi:hypothetical protein